MIKMRQVWLRIVTIYHTIIESKDIMKPVALLDLIQEYQTYHYILKQLKDSTHLPSIQDNHYCNYPDIQYHFHYIRMSHCAHHHIQNSSFQLLNNRFVSLWLHVI